MEEEPEAVTLNSLANDLVARILLASGATTVGRAACTCRRFRDLAVDLRYTPACASSLVRVPPAEDSEQQATTWPQRFRDAAVAAARASLGKLRSGSVSFVILAASPQPSRRVRLPELLESVVRWMPGGQSVPVLGLFSSAVVGPTRDGAVEEHEDAVVALVVSLPAGYSATVSTPMHEFGEEVEPHTEADLLRWLRAPPGCASPAWCAFWMGPNFDPHTGGDDMFAIPFELSRIFPACAIVGGAVRGIAAFGSYSAGNKADLVTAATLTVWPPPPDGGRNPAKLRVGALAARGLAPCGAVHLVEDLESVLEPGHEPADDELVPQLVSTRPLGPALGVGVIMAPCALLAEVVTARIQRDVPFLHIWREEDDGAQSNRARTAFDVDFNPEFDRCVVLAPTTFKPGPGKPRVLCQLMKQDAGAARACSRAGAQSLAAYVTGASGADVQRCVVSAVCNGRGASLFGGEEHVEAAALGAAFGDAVIGVVCGGELGPIADVPLLDRPMPATATLQAFTNCLAALGMPVGASV